MDLQVTRDAWEPELDDLFRGFSQHVTRVDELHATPDNDATYVFIVWVDEDYHDFCLEKLKENVEDGTIVQALTPGIIAVTEDVC